jgi:transcriptional regulator with XRE-family HTH domain
MDELREIRKVRGLSQRALATKAGVDKVTIIHAEQGKKHPHAETLEKLAGALEVSVADLIQPPYEAMTLEQLMGEGYKVREEMVEATEKGDMLRLDLLLRRGQRISSRINELDPPLATIKYRPDAPPEVTYLRPASEEEKHELESGLEKTYGEFTVNEDLLLIG